MSCGGRGAHGVVEVVGPAAGAAPRARDGDQAADVRLARRRRAARATPRAGLTVGAAAAGEKLDTLGDDVDARGVAAVLRLKLVEEQAAIDRDLAAGLEVLRARVGLRLEALDVEVAVLALLAGALDGDAQRADRGPAVGLQELRVLGEMAGAGPAVHGVLLRPVGAGCVTDKAATGAHERGRQALVRQDSRSDPQGRT